MRDEVYAKTTPRRLDPFPAPIIAQSVHPLVGQHKFICFPTSFRKLSSLGAPPHLGRCMHGSRGTHTERSLLAREKTRRLRGGEESCQPSTGQPFSLQRTMRKLLFLIQSNRSFATAKGSGTRRQCFGGGHVGAVPWKKQKVAGAACAGASFAPTGRISARRWLTERSVRDIESGVCGFRSFFLPRAFENPGTVRLAKRRAVTVSSPAAPSDLQQTWTLKSPRGLQGAITAGPAPGQC